MQDNLVSKLNKDNNDEVDINSLIKLFIRNKFLITFITLIGSLSTVLYTLVQPSVYEGSFEIIVEEKNKKKANSFEPNILKSIVKNSFNDKAQEFILKSPSVLKPIFDITKAKFIARNQNVEDLSYDVWVQKYLNIKFEEKTNILKVKYKDIDTNLILETLNLIKNKYQAYSKRDLEKQLKRTETYLNDQIKILKKQSKASLKIYNEFSMDNGLGSIDGFVGLRQNNNLNQNIRDLDNFKNSLNFLDKNIASQENPISKLEAGQRFDNQFRLLEQYEATYLDLSSKLTPKSTTLSNLKIKIENLRASLKRPNEILIKYRELLKKAERDERFLYLFENEITNTRLEIARQQDPWELISEPTLADNRISPKRTKSVLIAFVLSLIGGFFLARIKEKSQGVLYEFRDLESQVQAKYLETLFSRSKILSLKILKSFLNKNISEILKNNENKEMGLIMISNKQETKNALKEIINLSKEKSIKFVDFEDEKSIQKFDTIAFVLCTNDINENDISLLNKFISIYEEKLLGWFYLDETTVFKSF